MSEIPLPINDQDDTEGHCLGVRLTDIEAAERQLDGPARMPWVRGTEAEDVQEEAESEDVSAHVQPPRDLIR